MPSAKIAVVNPEKHTRTAVDTILIKRSVVDSWQSPPFQRPLKVNEKVRLLVETIKEDGGVIPGVITLGVLDRVRYIIDGQHRLEGWKLTGLDEGYADIRICHFDTMAKMGEEFVALNSRLVNLRPDDILRGLEGSDATLQRIRKRCPFVGYDNVRRGNGSPLLSMSALLRCWSASARDVPASSTEPAVQLVKNLPESEIAGLISYLTLCYQAWGADPEYYRLWGNLNLTIGAWLYRRTVIAGYSQRSARLDEETFKSCLMALSADAGYMEWLVGRQLSDRDRSPCYIRLKSIFASRIAERTGDRPLIPSPQWAHNAHYPAKRA